MQLLFPLSLPPLPNAPSQSSQQVSSQPSRQHKQAAGDDPRLNIVRTALRAAGLQSSKVIAKKAESATLQPALAHEQWLQQIFGWPRPDIANAALCSAGETTAIPALTPESASPATANLQAANCHWLVRPVHFNLALDHLVLAAEPQGAALLSHPEQWLAVLQEALAPGWSLVAKPSARQETLFTLTTPPGIEWAAKSSMQAMGRSIDRYLPTGQDARAWRRFLNHCQMLLHEHPLNAHREQASLSSINGFWLEGELNQQVPSISRSSMQSLTSALKTQPNSILAPSQLEGSADKAVFVLDDWITPTHCGDLETWTDAWERLPRFVQELRRLSRDKPGGEQILKLHFFGEAACLSLASRPLDHLRFWRLGGLL
jgi:hypothetical protein